MTEAQLHRITVGDLILDTHIFEATRAGRSIVLTSTEYRLLRHLMCNQGRVLAKSAILREIWGAGSEYNLNLVEAVVSCLRKKIDKGERPMIHTRRGFGYVLRAADLTPSSADRENRFAAGPSAITDDLADDGVREIAARMAGLSRQSQRELLRTAEELYERENSRHSHIVATPHGQTA